MKNSGLMGYVTSFFSISATLGAVSLLTACDFNIMTPSVKHDAPMSDMSNASCAGTSQAGCGTAATNNAINTKPGATPTGTATAAPTPTGTHTSTATPTPTVTPTVTATPTTAVAQFPGTFSVTYTGESAGMPAPVSFFAQKYASSPSTIYVEAFEAPITFANETQSQPCPTGTPAPTAACTNGHVTSVLFAPCVADSTGMCKGITAAQISGSTALNFNGTMGTLSYTTLSVGVCENGANVYYSSSSATTPGSAATGYMPSYTDRPGTFQFTALTGTVPSNVSLKTPLISGKITGAGLRAGGVATGTLKSFDIQFSNLTLIGDTPACH